MAADSVIRASHHPSPIARSRARSRGWANLAGMPRCVFAAGATVASFAAAGETTCNPGDILSLTAPSPADAALANLYFNLRGRLA